MFPWIIWNAVNDFHGVTLSVPLLLFAIWFLDEHRLVSFSAVALLALASVSFFGLTVAALGIWYAIHHRRVRAGVAIAAIGAGWTTLCLTVVIPAFNDGHSSRYYSRFETVGGSPSGLLATLVTDPGTIVEALRAAPTCAMRYSLFFRQPYSHSEASAWLPSLSLS